jgi:recombination protein RecT
MATNMLIDIKADLEKELVPAQSLLPAHVSFDRFTNAAAVALATNRDLFDAERQSVINALTACAKDGLIPDGREAALVTFKKKQPDGTRISVAQYMPMIDGVLKRARQSGEVAVIATRVVYEKDTFRAWLDDTGEHLLYEPTLGERGEMVGAFAYAKMKSGELQFEWLNLYDIEKVRSASKNSDFGPWKDWYESMSRKSAAHRLCRRLPNNSEIMEMLERGSEMVWQKEKDITPPPASRVNLDHIPTDDTVLDTDDVIESESDVSTLADELRTRIDDATAEDARKIGNEVDELKLTLGVDLHTELRNKAVKRYHQIVAQTKINTLINDLPNPGEPDAPQRFSKLEQSLQAAKSRLGVDLYEGLSITLADMKPEYCI